MREHETEDPEMCAYPCCGSFVRFGTELGGDRSDATGISAKEGNAKLMLAERARLDFAYNIDNDGVSVLSRCCRVLIQPTGNPYSEESMGGSVASGQLFSILRWRAKKKGRISELSARMAWRQRT